MSTLPQTLESAKKPSYRPRKTLKPPALQAKILAHRAIGTSKEQIARDLSIDKRTVTSIIELHDFDRELETGRSLSVNLIPDAIRVAKHRLSQNSENMAIKVLENTIWPLNQKAGKSNDPHLTLAIQNLMGNVTLQSQPNQQDSNLQPISTPSASKSSDQPITIVPTPETAK